MKIIITNPYYEKEYEVMQDKAYLENRINNCVMGNEPFINLTTVDGLPLVINPSNIASMEVLAKQ